MRARVVPQLHGGLRRSVKHVLRSIKDNTVASCHEAVHEDGPHPATRHDEAADA